MIVGEDLAPLAVSRARKRGGRTAIAARKKEPVHLGRIRSTLTPEGGGEGSLTSPMKKEEKKKKVEAASYL